MHDLNTEELVQLAWDALPSSHRWLLAEIGAARWEIVDKGLGQAVQERLRSAGEAAIEDRGVAQEMRGFALSPGETAEQFLAAREDVLRNAGIEPRWPGAAEIRRKIEAGELGT